MISEFPVPALEFVVSIAVSFITEKAHREQPGVNLVVPDGFLGSDYMNREVLTMVAGRRAIRIGRGYSIGPAKACPFLTRRLLGNAWQHGSGTFHRLIEAIRSDAP